MAFCRNANTTKSAVVHYQHLPSGRGLTNTRTSTEAGRIVIKPQPPALPGDIYCGSLAKDPAARLRPPHPPSVIGFDAFLRGGGTLNPRPARFAPFNTERDIPGPICAPGNALRRVGRYVIAGGVWKERKFGFSWRAVLGSCLAGRTIVWHRHTKQVLLRCVLPSGTAKLLVRFSCINRFYTFSFHAYQLTKRSSAGPPLLRGAS